MTAVVLRSGWLKRATKPQGKILPGATRVYFYNEF
jgi:hypothetical protein